MTELKVLTAYDEQPLATLPMQDEAQCMAALDRAHGLYADRDAWLPLHERVAILERAAGIIESRAEELALQAAREGGKPLRDSTVEVSRGVQGLRAAVAELHSFGGTEVPMGLRERGAGRVAWTFREPRGVVFAISAFNHPFNLIVHQVVPAVAVGAPVVVKPASDTPLSCKALVDILHEAGLPEGWCEMLLCDNDVAEKIVADRRVAFLTFIGSHRVGWHLRSRLAPGAACVLEHGGVAPALVEATADLDDAIPLLVKGGFYHAGQVCVSVQRIYVHEDVMDRFTAAFVPQVQALKVGDPSSPDTEVGPLIRPAEVDRVESWVSQARGAGAQVLAGGERISRTCFAPTVLRDPPDDAKVSCDEVFGPVVSLYGYRDLDDAIRRANGPDSYFQAAIFTRDLEHALRAHRRLRGMVVMINDHTAFRVDWMPFGGHLSSGLGAGGIRYTMDEMALERMVVIRSPEVER
jgi:acyl-CoA reductase-like NAD-dependent aldehyde dehydrogenase